MGHMTWPRPFQGRFVICRLGCSTHIPNLKSTITCNENMKGNAKCKYSRFEPPFGEIRGNARDSSMARWKAHCWLLISGNWTFFAIFHGWKLAKNIQYYLLVCEILRQFNIKTQKLIDFPTSPVICSHFTLGNLPKNHFQHLPVRTSDYLRYLSKTLYQHIALWTFCAEWHRSSSLISPDMWPPNGPDLNPVDYRIWAGACVSSSNPLYGRVAAAASWNMDRAWWMMRLISGEKDWKRVSMQKMVTLNTCCDVAWLI